MFYKKRKKNMRKILTVMSIFLFMGAFISTEIYPDRLSLKIEHSGQQKAPANAAISYQIYINNPHKLIAKEAVVTLYIENASFVSASHNGAHDSGRNAIVWQFNKIAAGEIKNLSYVIKTPEKGNYSVCSTATAKFTDCVFVEIVKPILSCTANIPKNISLLDKYITGTFSVSNSGHYVANDTIVKVTLNNLQFEDGSQSATFSDVNIKVNERFSKNLKLKPVADGKCGIYVRVASPNTNTTDCSDLGVIATPRLLLTKSAPGIVYVKSTFIYQILVKNTGSAPVTDLVITDRLPAGMKFMQTTYNGKYNGGTIKWYFKSLGVGEETKILIKVQAVEKHSSPGWENIAYANCAELETLQANAFTVVNIVPALTIYIFDDIDPVRVGDNYIYTMAVNNEGQEKATNVRIKFILPEEATYLGYDGKLGATSGGGNLKGTYNKDTREVIFDNIHLLQPNSGGVFRVKLKASKESSAIGTVSATFDEFSKPFIAQEPTTFYKD